MSNIDLLLTKRNIITVAAERKLDPTIVRSDMIRWYKEFIKNGELLISDDEELSLALLYLYKTQTAKQYVDDSYWNDKEGFAKSELQSILSESDYTPYQGVQDYKKIRPASENYNVRTYKVADKNPYSIANMAKTNMRSYQIFDDSNPSASETSKISMSRMSGYSSLNDIWSRN